MVYGIGEMKPEAMQKLVKDRGLTCPVLFDPAKAYREAAARPTYPTATLLGRDGRVVWQGQTIWRKQFADACEKAVEAALSR